MRSVADTVWAATGVHPVTAPPFSFLTFDPKVFERHKFIWLGLHGTTDTPGRLYGDVLRRIMGIPVRSTALEVDQLDGLDLEGAIVFASTCYLPLTDFPAAFKACGAQVIGGPGKNYGHANKIIGADLLGATLLAVIQQGTLATDLIGALTQAKHSLYPSRRADRDALEFAVL
jgi:hypothetical protein